METLTPEALFSIKGKNVLVTGGGTGIGFMIASAFIQNNAANVFICSRKREVCDEACRELNALGKGQAHSIPADLSKRKDVENLIQEIGKVTNSE